MEGAYFELSRVTQHDNIVNKYLVEPGQTIAGLQVDKVSRTGSNVDDVTFQGELTVTGSFSWEDSDDGGDAACMFTLDGESLKKVPLFEHIPNDDTIRLNTTDELKQWLPAKAGKATVVIDHYSMGERQITLSADVAKVNE